MPIEMKNSLLLAKRAKMTKELVKNWTQEEFIAKMQIATLSWSKKAL